MIRFIVYWIKTNVKEARIKVDTMGNIFVTKGNAETYPCVVAHIDEVHSKKPKDFKVIETSEILFGWSSGAKDFIGIGADDKSGVWLSLVSLMKYDNIKVALFVSERLAALAARNATLVSSPTVAIYCNVTVEVQMISSLILVEQSFAARSS